MSLATRCSACGTVFRVVQDQLKVSEGWVRCGRCNGVFNALEGLFDLERESPPEWQPHDHDDPVREVPVGGGAPDTQESASQEAPPSDPELVDRIDSELFGARGVSGGAARQGDEEQTPLIGRDGDVPIPRSAAAATDAARNLDGYEDSDSPDAPEFVRNAERAQRWNRPGVRAALGALAAVLFGLLGLQAAHHFRDDVAARFPDSAPAFAAWCEAAGCRIGAPRHIDDVAVESTALSRVGSADAYKLTIVLRNHGAVLVAVPAIDLALTDATGQLIARRALGARDFAGAPDRLAAGADLNLQTVLMAGATKVTGYTVELFYP